MAILGIETSCDETGVAIVSMSGKLLSNVLHSQIDIHAKYGGIVPEIASRQHILNINAVTQSAIQKSNLGWKDIKAVAVTYGPGLSGSLVIGLNFAKGLATSLGVPLVGVNHLHGHIAAVWLDYSDAVNECLQRAPIMCLVASGGHTDLALKRSYTEFSSVGRTRDDAAGEAFDKIARLLGLGYPGGPHIQRMANLATNSNDTFYKPLPKAWLKGTHDFSFSGLKTAVLNRVKNMQDGIEKQESLPFLAKAAQESIVRVLVDKTLLAAEKYKCSAIVVSGGVAANTLMKDYFKADSSLPVYIPPADLCTDNAGMIAIRGLMLYKMGIFHTIEIDIKPNLSIEV